MCRELARWNQDTTTWRCCVSGERRRGRASPPNQLKGRQARRGGRLDVTMSCSVCDLLERVRHPHQLVIVPGTTQQLNVDRLSVVVVADREDNGRNAI